jgi:hypothetical protein
LIQVSAHYALKPFQVWSSVPGPGGGGSFGPSIPAEPPRALRRGLEEDFFAEVLFLEDFFAEDFFAEDFFAEDLFAVLVCPRLEEDFLPPCPLFLAAIEATSG